MKGKRVLCKCLFVFWASFFRIPLSFAKTEPVHFSLSKQKEITISALAAFYAYTPESGTHLGDGESQTWLLKTTSTRLSRADKAGFVNYTHNDSEATIVVAFSGTHKLSHWMTNLNILRTSGQKVGIMGRVHKGFLKRYLSLKKTLDVAFNEIFKKIKDSKNFKTLKRIKVHVTGHSLGGALATVSAVDIRNKVKLEIKKWVNQGLKVRVFLDTFSAPRAMDANGAKDVNQKIRISNIRRFWRKGDVVPALPMGMGGLYYKHVGQEGGLRLDLPLTLETLKDFGPLIAHSHKLTVAQHADKHLVPQKGHKGFWTRQKEFWGARGRRATA